MDWLTVSFFLITSIPFSFTILLLQILKYSATQMPQQEKKKDILRKCPPSSKPNIKPYTHTLQNSLLITKPNQGFHCWRNWFSCGMLNNFTCFPHLGVRYADIILSKDGVRTIANIIIANLSSFDLLPWTTWTLRFTTSKVVHIKERTYKERVATKNKSCL